MESTKVLCLDRTDKEAGLPQYRRTGANSSASLGSDSGTVGGTKNTSVRAPPKHRIINHLPNDFVNREMNTSVSLIISQP